MAALSQKTIIDRALESLRTEAAVTERRIGEKLRHLPEIIKYLLQKSFQDDPKCDFYLSKSIQVVDEITPLSFHRDYIARNVPVVIKGGCSKWAAVKKWNTDYFREKFVGRELSIAVTPDGYADAIKTIAQNDGTSKEYFVMPEERIMKFSNFLDMLDNPHKNNGIFYLQSQNNNLNLHFPELLDDVGEDVPWASEAFNSKPDAVNLWMGDGRAVSSMHKDPYENIYCVVSGYKDFILLPPTDRPWIPYRKYPQAVHRENPDGSFDTVPCSGENEDIPWICIDPLHPNLQLYPKYAKASPLHIRVNAGDILYLPSLWFHHVCQSHACIAVNYWYDMQFDIKYVYYQLLEQLLTPLNS